MSRGLRPGGGQTALTTSTGGLVFKAHRLVYHSNLGLRAIKKKKKADSTHGGSVFENTSAQPRGGGTHPDNIHGGSVFDGASSGRPSVIRGGERAGGGAYRYPLTYPSGKYSQERLTRGTVTSTMRRAAHPSGCARCGSPSAGRPSVIRRGKHGGRGAYRYPLPAARVLVCRFVRVSTILLLLYSRYRS